jgi:hypothetical protein
MAGVHVGNDYNRREYIVMGGTIDEVSDACDAATYGEIKASPQVYDVLMRGKSDNHGDKSMDRKPQLIAFRDTYHFERDINHSPSNRNEEKRIVISSKEKDDIVHFDIMDTTSLKYLHKLVSYYVHPLVISDDLTRKSDDQRVDPNQALRSKLSRRHSTVDSHRAKAELRSVYTLFIKPIIRTKLMADELKNQYLFDMLNDILQVVISILDGFRGHLRQFIVDDKGTFNIDYFVFIIL